MELEQALIHCRQLTRSHSSTFYLGASLFPAPQRQAVMVVYALCRTADDAVDECATPEEGRRGLEAWRRQVERAFAGTPDPREPLELGLAWVLEGHDLPREAFVELHLGLASDLDGQGFSSVDELLLYCRRVAGVVGLLVAPIAGYSGGRQTLQDAVALGQAMQLTNILRDVGEDLGRGRCYLPRDLMARHGVETEDLHSGRITPGYVALLEELTRLARRLYRTGWGSVPRLHGPTAVAVGSAALCYEAILARLARNGYDNLTRRAHLGRLERLLLVPNAAFAVHANDRAEAGCLRGIGRRYGLQRS